MKKIIHHESIVIAFKESFSHHSKTRESTESIVVSIKNENNVTGLGEACPRSYVTGESIQSAQSFIDKMTPTISNIRSLEELNLLRDKMTPEIDKNPSAWCALELAMLDLLAKESAQSVENLLGCKSSSTHLAYTAVIGIGSYFKTLIKILLYKTMLFSDFKIKLSGNAKLDLRTLRLTSFFAKSIRVDANNLFKNKDDAISYLEPIKSYIWAIEEPVVAHAFSEMKEIAKALNIKIILDESFLNQSSFEKIKSDPNLFIPNLRISKMGGILRTMKLIEILEEHGFEWILGSHVGEMSLLTRAALLISGQQSKNLKAIEGGFSTHLLSYDIFFPNLVFGKGAVIKNDNFLNKYGWGMTMRKE